jgi:hypothetical protein
MKTKPKNITFWKPIKSKRKIVRPRTKHNNFVPNIFKIKPDYKRTIREKKLIKTNPWGDKDGDGVPNWIDCKPFDRKRQHLKPYKFKAITEQGKEHVFRYKTKSQADIHRESIASNPNYKEVTEIYPVVSIYSVRPFKEKYANKIYPSETGGHRDFSRDTGYEGTGIFGLHPKQIAQKYIDNRVRSGYIREFMITNPFMPVSDYRADRYFEASKLLQKAVDTKRRTVEGREKYLTLIRNAQNEIKASSYDKIAPTMEDLKKVTTYRKGSKRTFQPITRLLMKAGYEGYIPPEKHQNFGEGSVAFMGKVPIDKTLFTSEEIKRKKEYYKDKKQESQSKIEAKKTQFGELVYYSCPLPSCLVVLSGNKIGIPDLTAEQALNEVEQEEKNIKGTYALAMEKMKELYVTNPESISRVIDVLHSDDEENTEKKLNEKGAKSIQRKFYEKRIPQEIHPATILLQEDFATPTAEEILIDIDKNHNMIPDSYEDIGEVKEKPDAKEVD